MAQLKDGYRFIQFLIPVKTHKLLAKTGRQLGWSNAETARQALEEFLKNPTHKEKDSNDN